MSNHLPGRGPRDCGPNQGGCSHGVAGNGSGRSNLGDTSNAQSGEGYTTHERAMELARASPTGTYAFYPSVSQLNAERAQYPGGGDDGGGGSFTSGFNSIEIPDNNPFDRDQEIEDEVEDIKRSYFSPESTAPVIEEFLSENNNGRGNDMQETIQDFETNNVPKNLDKSANYGLDLKRRSDARERAKNWLELSAVAG